MRELIDKLNYYTKLYDEGNPAISDKEWDELYFKLQKMENESNLIYPDSPTQKINFEEVSELQKVTHSHPMLSLAKTKDIDDLKAFIDNRDVITMLKMDGLTCSLTYENGVLTKAETRGNGMVGENIIHNALVIKNIPKKIDYKETLVVDGEIICDYKTFEEFSNDYANPRNFAAGSIRLLNSRESASRRLSFIVWDVIEGLYKNSLSDKLIAVEQLGFSIVPMLQPDKNYTIEENIDFLKMEAVHYGYPIDGIVVKYDDVEYYNSLGSTDHHFRGGMAFKFYDEEYDTELLRIDYDVSRMGVLTPVAVFKPIDTGESIIERASLHNLSVMEELLGKYPDLYQPIKVIKANQIIPQVVSAEYKNDTPHDHIIFDSSFCCCPICGTLAEVSVSDSGIKTLICPNSQCEGKLVNIIDHFVGKKGLDVKGLSKATIEKLSSNGWLNCRADIFKLHEVQTEWEKLPGFGRKSVSNILESIEAAKSTDFEHYLAALGIPLIGSRVSKELAKTFKSYSDFRTAIREGYDFSTLDGFGTEMNKALNNYDYTEADEIAELLTFETKEEVKVEQSVAGMTFVITGKLSRKRSDIQVDIEAAGGKVTGSVSAKTNYLVCNDKNSTTGKSADAARLNIPVINEEELMELLK